MIDGYLTMKIQRRNGVWSLDFVFLRQRCCTSGSKYRIVVDLRKVNFGNGYNSCTVANCKR